MSILSYKLFHQIRALLLNNFRNLFAQFAVIRCEPEFAYLADFEFDAYPLEYLLHRIVFKRLDLCVSRLETMLVIDDYFVQLLRFNFFQSLINVFSLYLSRMPCTMTPAIPLPAPIGVCEASSPRFTK